MILSHRPVSGIQNAIPGLRTYSRLRNEGMRTILWPARYICAKILVRASRSTHPMMKIHKPRYERFFCILDKFSSDNLVAKRISLKYLKVPFMCFDIVLCPTWPSPCTSLRFFYQYVKYFSLLRSIKILCNTLAKGEKLLHAFFFDMLWYLMLKSPSRYSLPETMFWKWKGVKLRDVVVSHKLIGITKVFICFGRKPDNDICTYTDIYSVISFESKYFSQKFSHILTVIVPCHLSEYTTWTWLYREVKVWDDTSIGKCFDHFIGNKLGPERWDT